MHACGQLQQFQRTQWLPERSHLLGKMIRLCINIYNHKRHLLKQWSVIVQVRPHRTVCSPINSKLSTLESSLLGPGEWTETTDYWSANSRVQQAYLVHSDKPLCQKIAKQLIKNDPRAPLEPTLLIQHARTTGDNVFKTISKQHYYHALANWWGISGDWVLNHPLQDTGPLLGSF